MGHSEMTTEHDTSDVRMMMELTGLSYADWEKDALRLQRAADRSAASGLLDNQHLGRAAEIEASIDDEIAIVDDIGSMVDAETAGQLGTIRTKLWALRERIHGALQKMSGLTKASR